MNRRFFFYVSAVLSRGFNFTRRHRDRRRCRANEWMFTIYSCFLRRRRICQVNMETTRMKSYNFVIFSFSTSVQGDVFNRFKVVRRCKHILARKKKLISIQKSLFPSRTSILINKYAKNNFAVCMLTNIEYFVTFHVYLNRNLSILQV